jgi:hypothetical protein
MNKRHGLLFGFTVQAAFCAAAIAAMFTLAGCPTGTNNNSGGPTAPAEVTIDSFVGTWKKINDRLVIDKEPLGTFTLKFTTGATGSAKFEYTLFYTGGIETITSDAGYVLGKGVKFTGTGKQTTGTTGDHVGIVNETYTALNTSKDTSGYLVIANRFLEVYFKYGSSGLKIDGEGYANEGYN